MVRKMNGAIGGRMARRGSLGVVPLAAGLLLLALLSAIAGPARADGSGITVINVPPNFNGIDIRSQDGLNYVDVTVSDYNSWADIFRVEVRAMDESRAQVARVAFQQYPNNTTSQRQPSFVETEGTYLVRDLSGASYDLQPETIPERTEMRITFVLTPVKGRWINVTATDLGALAAYVQVEYQAGLVGGLPQVSPILSWAIASAAAIALVVLRIRRDRREF